MSFRILAVLTTECAFYLLLSLPILPLHIRTLVEEILAYGIVSTVLALVVVSSATFVLRAAVSLRAQIAPGSGKLVTAIFSLTFVVSVLLVNYGARMRPEPREQTAEIVEIKSVRGQAWKVHLRGG